MQHTVLQDNLHTVGGQPVVETAIAPFQQQRAALLTFDKADLQSGCLGFEQRGKTRNEFAAAQSTQSLVKERIVFLRGATADQQGENGDQEPGFHR